MIQIESKTDFLYEMFPPRRINGNLQTQKPWTYPPLPPNHIVSPKKVSFSNAFLDFANGDDSASILIDCAFSDANSDHVKKIVNKYDTNEYDHESSDCGSLCMNENNFKEELDRNFNNAEELDNLRNENNDRMRGGCGGNCPCKSENVVGCENQNVDNCHRNIKKISTIQDCIEPRKNREISPDDFNENINRSETSIINSPSYCCPTADSRPVCAKSSRCNSPCKSDGPCCGGGGCCGTGCRGGCGKPGRLCMPLRTCSGSTNRNHSFVSRSHWSLLKSDTPRLVSHCTTQTACRESDTSVNEQQKFLKHDDYNCHHSQLSRSKSGCECLGGGSDCQRCGRKVYQAEMMIAAGSPYHAICFSCYCCRKPLEPLTYQENCGEIYCKQCLIRNFGPQGYGYGIGAGVLQTPI